MRNQHADVDLIEVFAPDDAALWADAAPVHAEQLDSPIGQRPTRRGVVLVGLLVAGAVVGAATLSNDEQSQVAPPATVLATPTTVRLPLAPSSDTHFLIENGVLTAYAADIVTPPPRGQQVQVWTNGTSVGPLVTIELHPHAYEPYGIVGASRDVVDGVELVRPITQPQSWMSEVAIDDTWSATVRATDLNGADVARIVGSVRVINSELPDDSEVMADLGLGLTFEDESLDDLIFGRVESTVRYLTVGGDVVTLHSAVGSSEHRLAAFSLLTTGAQPFFYGSSHGRLPNGDAIVVWVDDGRLLSLVAPGDPVDLISISQQVRRASDAEWTAMLYGLRPDYTLGEFATQATGLVSDTELWRAGPQIAQRDGRTEFLWWWTVPGTTDFSASTAASGGVGSQPHFDTVVVPGATFVFVSQPDSGGTVTVHAIDGTEYLAELLQPFTQSPVYMAVVRIETPGPITVTIDGEPVHA